MVKMVSKNVTENFVDRPELRKQPDTLSGFEQRPTNGEREPRSNASETLREMSAASPFGPCVVGDHRSRRNSKGGTGTKRQRESTAQKGSGSTARCTLCVMSSCTFGPLMVVAPPFGPCVVGDQRSRRNSKGWTWDCGGSQTQ